MFAVLYNTKCVASAVMKNATPTRPGLWYGTDGRLGTLSAYTAQAMYDTGAAVPQDLDMYTL